MASMTRFLGRLVPLLGTCLFLTVTTARAQTPDTAHHTVFVILMENHNWSSIKGSPSAPYINNTLLPMGAHAEQYYNPPKLHPSEPNYIWLEAGDNFGIPDDAAPITNHLSTDNHLVHMLTGAGLSWETCQQGVDGKRCRLMSHGLYSAKR